MTVTVVVSRDQGDDVVGVELDDVVGALVLGDVVVLEVVVLDEELEMVDVVVVVLLVVVVVVASTMR
jgi:hypothetical protein